MHNLRIFGALFLAFVTAIECDRSTQNATQTTTENSTQTATQIITQATTENSTQTMQATQASTQNVTQTTQRATQPTQATTQATTQTTMQAMQATTNNATQNSTEAMQVTQASTQNATQATTLNATQTTQATTENSTQTATQSTQSTTQPTQATTETTTQNATEAMQVITENATQNATQTKPVITENATQTFVVPFVYWEGPFNGSDLMSRRALDGKLFQMRVHEDATIQDIQPIAQGENVTLRKAYTIPVNVSLQDFQPITKGKNLTSIPFRPPHTHKPRELTSLDEFRNSTNRTSAHADDAYQSFFAQTHPIFILRQIDSPTEVIHMKAHFAKTSYDIDIVPGKSAFQILHHRFADGWIYAWPLNDDPYVEIICRSALSDDDALVVERFWLTDAYEPIYESVRLALIGCARATMKVWKINFYLEEERRLAIEQGLESFLEFDVGAKGFTHSVDS